MTINIFVLKGDLNGENSSGAFLFLPGIFLNQNICCGYSKEPCHLLKIIGKKIFTILR